MAEIVVKLVNGELAGKTAQSIAKEVSAAALALKKAEIGTKQWVAANKRLEEAKEIQADLKKQIDGTSEASELLKKSWNSLPGAQYFNQIADSFGFMKKGVGGLISQFGMLKIAIASTGIGLLVLALSSLISYFSTTQEGIDKITAVTRPLKAVFDALVGVLQNVGGTLFKKISDAVKDPMAAFEKLGQIIKENIINRFKALALLGPALKKIFSGDLSGGFKDLGNAALQAATGVENVIDKVVAAGKQIAIVIDEAYKKGQRLDQLQKDIERAEINQVVRSKQLELALKQQKDIVEDSTKSWDDRRAAAVKALAIQQQMLNDELSILDKRIEKMKIEQSLNDTSREQEKELAELVAKRLELQAKTTEQSIEWKKKITEFDIAQAAEQAAIIKSLGDLRLSVEEKTLEELTNKILLSQAEKIKLLTGTEEQIAEEKIRIELETEQQLRDIRAQALALEIQKIVDDAAIKAEAIKGTEEQKTQQALLIEQERDLAIRALKDEFAIENAAKDQQFKDEQEQRDKLAAEKKKALQKELLEIERKMYDEEQQLALDTFQLGSDLLAKDKQLGQAAKTFNKGIALTDIGINLQKELSANAVAAAANPLNAATFGAAGAAQLLRANTASIIRAAIGTARVVAFRKGGIPSGVLHGPSHEQGGIPLVAEGEEIILTKGVYRDPRLRSIASQINVAAGGRSFATGGPTNPIQSVSYVDRSRGPISRAGDPGLFDYEAMARANSKLVDEKIARIKVENVVTETEGVLKTINMIQDAADV